ncbi:hypothetical protein M404DRAFT_999404 [Pisolithus tinctorius Marx 270]|uniref:Uncharacterized protein n=1 Tax=Pisolithus tinctorius Marx 270 TaxID=870435 RepID=A0A0C3PDF8_PISTI|nr:hypothetical protein M404DRAFT_999404 [Pisolithus tinctorius Marx 270]
MTTATGTDRVAALMDQSWRSALLVTNQHPYMEGRRSDNANLSQISTSAASCCGPLAT